MPEGDSFEALGLDQDLLASINALGFEAPTDIQRAVIPRLLQKAGDIVGLAQTGTGKTAAFGLPIIQTVVAASPNVQVLILCPTRELCLQITRDLMAYSKHKPGVRAVAVYGGSSIERQIMALRRGAHIVVATPGRIHDLVRRKAARLGGVTRVVLDEADEMMSMGFTEDLEAILSQVPDTAQTLLFSATMPTQVASIASRFMKEPEEIAVGKRNAGAENVTHICYTVREQDRYQALKRVADLHPEMYGIVFCRTRVETQQIAEMLIRDGYDADALHGDLNQPQRDRVMNRFRARNLRMLVATDVAARGLDVNDLTHIINYNLPDDLELYTHRSGRTGRAGRAGTSVVITRRQEKVKLRRIEQLTRKKFEFRRAPTGQEVCQAQLQALVRRVQDVRVDEEQLGKFLPGLLEMLEEMSREELIKHFISLEANRILEYYRREADLNLPETKAPQREKWKKKPDEFAFKKLFINMGKRDRLSPMKLMELINNATPGRSVEIGHIDIRSNHAFFEVEGKAAAKVINSLRGADFGGKDFHVLPVDESGEQRPVNPRSGRGRQPRPTENTIPGRPGPKGGPKKKAGKPPWATLKAKPHKKHRRPTSKS